MKTIPLLKLSNTLEVAFFHKAQVENHPYVQRTDTLLVFLIENTMNMFFFGGGRGSNHPFFGWQWRIVVLISFLIDKCTNINFPSVFSFWYLASGRNSGNLSLTRTADDDVTASTLWSVAGVQGRRWQQAVVTLGPGGNVTVGVLYIFFLKTCWY